MGGASLQRGVGIIMGLFEEPIWVWSSRWLGGAGEGVHTNSLNNQVVLCTNDSQRLL